MDNENVAAQQSLYRKWRSQTFDELVGQEHVVRTLQNALATGRLAHAYLFTGPRGTGKTSTARLLAKAVNCLHYTPDAVAAGRPVPCGECANCRAVQAGNAIDLVEIDAASNTGVDDVRVIRDGVNFSPTLFKYRVYIIDEVHMLSTAAFNALLKTLEEPPEHAIFILATTEVHKIPATVLSRCQRYDFRRVPMTDMVARVEHVCRQEGIVAERPAIELICRAATGSMRDALSLLDQLVAYTGSNVTLEAAQAMLGATGGERVAAFADALIGRDLGTGLGQIGAMQDDGVDLRQFNRQLVEYVRNLMLLKAGGADMPALDVTQEQLARLSQQAEVATLGQIVGWVKIFSAADASLRSTPYGQLPLEVAFVEATLVGGQPTIMTETPPVTRVINQQPQPQPRSIVTPPPATIAEPPLPPVTQPTPRVLPPVTQAEPPLPPATQPAPRVLPPVAAASQSDDEPASGGASLDEVIGHWPQVIEAMGQYNRSMQAVLRDSQPLEVEGNKLTLGFRYDFHKRKTEEPGNRQLVEQMLGKVLGGQWGVICQLDEGQPAPSRRPQTRTDRVQAAKQDERVRIIANIFNGRVIDVQD